MAASRILPIVGWLCAWAYGDAAMQELRTEPRQRRSQQSIDAILDAAERLIHEQGQVGFTANELAAAARHVDRPRLLLVPRHPGRGHRAGRAQRAPTRRGVRRVHWHRSTASPRRCCCSVRSVRCATTSTRTRPPSRCALTGGARRPRQGAVRSTRRMVATVARHPTACRTSPTVEVRSGRPHGRRHHAGHAAAATPRRPAVASRSSSRSWCTCCRPTCTPAIPPPNDFRPGPTPSRRVQPSRPSRRDFTESSHRSWPALAPDAAALERRVSGQLLGRASGNSSRLTVFLPPSVSCWPTSRKPIEWWNCSDAVVASAARSPRRAAPGTCR